MCGSEVCEYVSEVSLFISSLILPLLPKGHTVGDEEGKRHYSHLEYI